MDSPVKVSGQAKYTYDITPPGHALRQGAALSLRERQDREHRHQRGGKDAGRKSRRDYAEARRYNIHWAGDEIVAVAAVDEATAEDAIRAIKVKYQQLPHLVSDAEPPRAPAKSQGPLSMDDIGDMLDNQVPDAADDHISSGVRHQLSKPDDDMLKEMKEEGAPDAVLDAFGKLPYHAATGGRHSALSESSSSNAGRSGQGILPKPRSSPKACTALP